MLPAEAEVQPLSSLRCMYRAEHPYEMRLPWSIQTAREAVLSPPADASIESTPIPLQGEAGYAAYHDDEALRTANGQLARSRPPVLASNNSIVGSLVLSSAVADDKYLELVAQLPPDAIAREFLDTYFDRANWYFGILERYYFDEAYTAWQTHRPLLVGHSGLEILPRNLLHFPALLFQILAVALEFVEPDQPVAKLIEVQTLAARSRLSHRWSQKGAELMTYCGFENPSILAVQHELMRASWLKNSGRGRSAWHLLGSAIRLAQELGLHIQSHPPQSTGLSVERSLEWLWHDEFTRRLWAKLFSWDSHMAMSLGRPLLIRSDDCSIRPPLDCDFPSNPSATVHGMTSSHGQHSLYSAHYFQYAVAQKGHEVVSVGAHKPGFHDYSVVRFFDSQVSSLMNSLPSLRHGVAQDDAKTYRSTASHLHMLIVGHSFLLNLHRAHSATHKASREAAIQAALNILDAQQQLFDLLGNAHYKTFMLSYYSVDAGIYLAVTTAKYPMPNGQTARQTDVALQQTIQRLSWMSSRNALAQAGLQILRRCLRFSEQPTRNESPPRSHHFSALAEEDMPSVQPASIRGDACATLLGDPSRTPTYADQSYVGLLDVSAPDFDDQDWDRMFAAITDANYTMDTFIGEFSEPPNSPR
ncbi:hypothetical protein, variant [Cladophialophora immunda]|uniref:Xylanolytic transcriptional activator regulatory domain-containing protein n=1 Tax=Cladophialophora immunda TaxID=569365 RepID=A0A0D2DHE7_9EURO|nr:hypothetical protein, variant [Cladophialophora immunda]KIW35184.1 hypothetical protein, variant [Cladophialophora immunda]OQV04648.1 Fungal specific transcription factor domain-containing protein [Cladophialophora immunda]